MVWNPWRGCKRYSEGCKHCYIHKGDLKRGINTEEIVKTKDFYKPIERLKNGNYKMKSGLCYLCFQSDFLIEEADEWRNEVFKMIKENLKKTLIFTQFKGVANFVYKSLNDFDIGAGIKEAFKKLNEKREEIRKQKEEEEKKIKVGDWVKVVNFGAGYTTHTDFFVRNNIPIQYCVNYCYGSNLDNGDVGKVLFIAEDKAVIQSTVADCCDFAFDDAIYLVGLSGLKKVKKPNV